MSKNQRKGTYKGACARTERLSPREAIATSCSNLGDRLRNLREGVRRLPLYGVFPRQVSRVYETVPVGETPDPRLYLNLGVWAETELSPHDLLHAIKAVEAAQGRAFTAERWMPRPLDIDIILYGDLVLETPDLTIPHPRMRERAFVLIPLAEMTPDYTLPDGTRRAGTVARPANPAAGGTGLRC
jgi:2-amino-4-hydroxy-6-hydroxymethyldihydropteridine diphosphokinase